MSEAGKSAFELMRLAILYIIIGIANIFTPDVFLLRNVSTLLLLILAAALLIMFSERIIDRKLRRCLVSVAAVLVAWIMLRGAKYIAFEESETVARHIWYLYYVPVLSIPQISLLAALSLGGGGERKKAAVLRVTAVITGLLMLLVLTNDLHQWAFRFNPGFFDWDSDYRRGILFVIVYVWIILLLTAALIVLYRRCRLSESRKLIWAPIIPAVFGVVYTALYAADLWPTVNGVHFGELPEAISFTVAGLWISFISIGLIPSNEGYARLFEASELSAQISDGDFNVIYRSGGAAALTPEQLRSEKTVMLDENTRVHRRAVKGGFVYWQDDVTELNAINAQLFEVGERLSEEAELIRMENELEKERAQIEARTKVYDRIADEVRPQFDRIAELCSRAEENPELYEKSMSEVCLLGAFIKRYSNLSLLVSDSPEIPAGELQLAVSESLRRLADMGIPTAESASPSGSIPAERALGAYALFENIVEQALPALKGVTAVLTEKELKLTIEGAAVSLSEGDASITAEDGSSYVRLPLCERGELS